jgi:hypothetical protein
VESTQRFLDLPFFRDGVRLRTRFLDDCVRDSGGPAVTLKWCSGWCSEEWSTTCAAHDVAVGSAADLAAPSSTAAGASNDSPGARLHLPPAKQRLELSTVGAFAFSFGGSLSSRREAEPRGAIV